MTFNGRDLQRQCLVLSAILIVGLFCCTGVSARYATPEGSNAGINPGDRIFLTEETLNFTVFKNVNPLLNPFDIAYKDGTNPAAMQPLDSNAVLISPIAILDSKYLNGPFYPYYSDSSWGTSRVIISQATIGGLKIRPVGTDITPSPSDPALTTIPYDMNVQFQLESTNLNAGNFSHPYYKYTLQLPDGQKRTQVVNMAGSTVSLQNLIANPTLNDNTLAFMIKNQNVTNTAGTFYMTFQTQTDDTNKLDLSTSLAFTVRTQGLAANFTPPNTTRGNTVTLRIYGKPYTYYTIVVPDSDDGRPQFPVTGTYDIYTSQYNVTVHPDVNGVVQVPMYVPVIGGDNTGSYRYYYPKIYATNAPSQSVTAQLAVGDEPGGLTTTSVIPVKPDLDPDEFFSIGDTISIKVKVGKDVDTAYFYITGPNLCENGAKPSEPWVCVVDGDDTTFDSLPVSSDQDNFYKWDTMGSSIEPATYRLFAGQKPVGYKSRNLAAGNAEDYIDLDFVNPSINAKFPEEAPGFFAQGDYAVSLWTARGSPLKEGTDGKYGTIRWYILGTNYRYTGSTTFPLLKVDGSSITEEEMDALIKGGHDFPGYSGINFARNYTYGLMEGDYYLVYQHPMYNNVFDLYPEQGVTYTGTFTNIYSSSGNKHLDLSTMETSDALSAMLALLKDPNIDDSLLTDHFVIQEPFIAIDPVLDFEVGDEILVDGSTNLEESYDYPYNQVNHPADKVTLSLYTSDMYYAGKTQSTYKVYSTEGSISALPPGGTKRGMSFTIPAETSAQMMPGEYVAVISCEDILYTTEITFVLHEQGYRKKNGITLKPAIGTEFSSAQGTVRPTRIVTPVKTATRTPAASRTATVTPTKKSPGMGGAAGILALIASAAILVNARRSRHER